jgi:hypothetical protein
MPPHALQGATALLAWNSRSISTSSMRSEQPRQRAKVALPSNSNTLSSGTPETWCRLSTFCEMTALA